MSNAVTITGKAEHIRQLEDSIFAASGVRVIITLPTNWEIFIDAEQQLSYRLSMDATVGDWKNHIQRIFEFHKNRKLDPIGQRGVLFPQVYDLPRHAIVFIQPNGKVAHARTLIKNIVFNKVS